jgi:hypothetical protein
MCQQNESGVSPECKNGGKDGETKHVLHCARYVCREHFIDFISCKQDIGMNVAC